MSDMARSGDYPESGYITYLRSWLLANRPDWTAAQIEEAIQAVKKAMVVEDVAPLTEVMAGTPRLQVVIDHLNQLKESK